MIARFRGRSRLALSTCSSVGAVARSDGRNQRQEQGERKLDRPDQRAEVRPHFA